VGLSLRDNVEQLRLSKTLAAIRKDVDLDVTVNELEATEADTGALRELYGHYELRSLLRLLDEKAGERAAPAPEKQGDYETVLTWDALDNWLEKINSAELTAFDTETTSLDYMEAEIVGFSLAVEAGSACYVPLAHDYPGAPEQLPRSEVLAKLGSFLENDKKKKVGHHLKYDAHILARHDISLKGMQFDSMLESYVLNSVATRHDMDSVARKYLGKETIHYEDVAGKGARQLTFNQIDLETAAPYAAEDADITLQLHNTLWEQLCEFPTLHSVYEEIEQPLVAVLLEMEEVGVLVDRKMLMTQSSELAMKMAELEAKAHELAGGPFNLGSPKQLQEILFEQLELPIIRKTPKGQPSTAEDVLVELANDYELPAVIIDYRSVSKLKSTYTVLPSGRRGDRTLVVDRSEPAEHPDPHARRATHPPGIRASKGPDSCRS
jgi:DNA polymerase-1